jgi:hypothetical protein
MFILFIIVQWKQFNVIRLGQNEVDNITKLKHYGDFFLILVKFWGLYTAGYFDVINHLITLSVITISSFFCTILSCVYIV